MKRFAVLFFLLAIACPKPSPPAPGSPPHPGVVQCTSQVVQQHWPEVLPAANKCLASAADGDWMGCLLALINPAAGITEDVVACVVHRSGASYADAAYHNATDQISGRAAKRAVEFEKTRGYTFP